MLFVDIYFQKLISVHKKIKVKEPILIAAWPGMGYVALKAAHYLKDKLRARLFASLKAEVCFSSIEVKIQNGLIDLSSSPDGKFYYWENSAGKNDLIIFISDQQPLNEKSSVYANEILNFSEQLNVQMIFTFAALLSASDYTWHPQVWLTCTHKELFHCFKEFSLKRLSSGHISGLNGLLLGVARTRNMKGVCFLGEIPFYTTQMENPYTSQVILEVFTKFFNIPLDLFELSMEGKVIEEEIERLVEQVKRPFASEEGSHPITVDEVEKIKEILSARTQIPNSARREIEDLFVKVRQDPSCVLELKKKLDEWRVYKDYEDRFLELFKKKDKKDH